MKISGTHASRPVAGLGRAACSVDWPRQPLPRRRLSRRPIAPRRIANTVGSATGSAREYLNNHPGANAVVTAAATQPRPQAAANLRAYFTAHPQEYYELRGRLAPIGEAHRQCNVAVLPPDLASAYDEFMAG